MLCSDFDPDRKCRSCNPRGQLFPPSRVSPRCAWACTPSPLWRACSSALAGGDPGPALLQRPGARVPGPGLGSGIRPVRAPCGRGRLRQHDGGAGGPRRAVLCVLWLLRGAAGRDHRRAPDPAHCRRPGRRALLPLICRLRTRWPWTPPAWPPAGRPWRAWACPSWRAKPGPPMAFYRETRGKVRRRREQDACVWRWNVPPWRRWPSSAGCASPNFSLPRTTWTPLLGTPGACPIWAAAWGTSAFAAAVEAGRRLLALP